MKKSIGAAAVAALVLAGVAFAGDRTKLSNKDVHKESALPEHAHLDSGQAPCHAEGGAVAGVLEQLPKLTYRAGELETPCFKTALAKAGDQDKLQYVVAGKTYQCRGEATAALASLLEQEAEKLMTVRPVVGDEYVHCPTMAKARAAELGTKVAYRLAGLSFETEQEAESTAGIVREAIAKMAAGKSGKDKPGCCPKAGKSGCGKGKAQTVAAKATEGGSGCSKSCAKTVAGLDGDCCAEAEKRLGNVQAKLRLIVETAAKALSS